MWKVSADPQSFEAALEYFSKRTPLTEEQLEQISIRARERAFTLSGVTSLALVSEVYEEVVGALKTGGDFAEFKAALLVKLNGEWGGSVKNPSARLKTVYRNAVQRSYNSGRYRQMREPAVMKARPYWMLDAVMDGATSDICAERDGITLSADDPFLGHLHASLAPSLQEWDSHPDGKKGEAEGHLRDAQPRATGQLWCSAGSRRVAAIGERLPTGAVEPIPRKGDERMKTPIILNKKLKKGEVPSEFQLFPAGTFNTVKGDFKFDDVSAATVMALAKDYGNELFRRL